MSGLDPLGRRDVRALILELRDRGCTVFFSSHILSDAEALCSRVAIVVGGQLVTSGRSRRSWRSRSRAWELVMCDLQPAAVESLGSAARKVTRISEGRYTIEVGRKPSPNASWANCGRGAAVSCRSTRADTLEDYFVRQVTARQAAPPAGRVMPEDDGTRHRPGRVPRLQGVCPRQGALHLVFFRRAVDLGVLPDRPNSRRARTSRSSRPRPGSLVGVRPLHRGVHRCGLVWKEVDRRSVYNLLVKPLRRHEFIVGKFVGLALTLAVNIAVMAGAALCRARR